MSLLIFDPWCHSWPDQTRSHSDIKLGAGLFLILSICLEVHYCQNYLTNCGFWSREHGPPQNFVLQFASPRSIGSVLTQAERQKRLDDRKDPVIMEDRLHTDIPTNMRSESLSLVAKPNWQFEDVYKCRLSFFVFPNISGEWQIQHNRWKKKHDKFAFH